MKLASAGEFSKAIPKFEASYEIDPTRGTLQGLAMAEEKAGKLAAALGHFRMLAGQARKARDTKRAALAEARVAQLEKRVPTVVVVWQSPPSDGKVSIDSSPLPAGALGSAIPVDLGTHTISASTSDGMVFMKEVVTKEGDSIKVEVSASPILSWGSPRGEPMPWVAGDPAKPVTKPAPRADQPGESSGALRTVGLVTGLVGVVAAGVGGYLYWDAGKDYDDVMAECSGNRCPQRLSGEVDSGRSQENLGRVFLIAGGVVGAVGVTLFVIGGPSSEKPGAMSASASPSGLWLKGRF